MVKYVRMGKCLDEIVWVIFGDAWELGRGLCEGVLGATSHSLLLCGGSQVSSEIFDDIAPSNTFYAHNARVMQK